MKRSIPAESPDAYLQALTGWRKALVRRLRTAVLGAGGFEEKIKWGHLVYFSNGPVLLIRAEEERVLFGFWRGKRLQDLDERLKCGGRYEMATVSLREGDSMSAAQAKALAKAAVALNRKLGDPTALPATSARSSRPRARAT